MLGARIDVIQPQIRNLIAYLLPLPDKKQTTAVVKRDKTSRLDRNHRQKSLSLKRTLLIRKGSIKYCLFGFVNLFNMFPCCCCSAMAWTQCCLGVRQKDGGRSRDGDWRRWLSRSDVTFLQSQGLVKRHSYFMQAVWALLWIDCFETYMVVT